MDDLAIEALARQVNARQPMVGLVAADTVTALDWLAADALLAVGVLGDCVAPSGANLARIQVAYQQFGLAAAPGQQAPTLAQVTARRERLASLPAGSDVRSQLDGVLRREGLDPRRAHARALIQSSYGDVAAALLRNEATLGVLTAAWAQRCGLAFFPLGSRPLGLVVKATALGHPALIRCWHVLQSVALGEALEALGGLEVTGPGQVQYLLDEVAPSEAPGVAPASEPGRAPWVLMVRARGVDASGALAALADQLRKRGLEVAGFVQHARRRKGVVVAYEARRLAGPGQVVVARRQRAPAAGTKLRAQSFHFETAAFEQAARWLVQDGRQADVVIIDGAAKLEGRGEGHHDALRWAARQRAPKVVVVAVRRDQSAVLSQRLGLAGRKLAVTDAEAGGTELERLVETIAAASREAPG